MSDDAQRASQPSDDEADDFGSSGTFPSPVFGTSPNADNDARVVAVHTPWRPSAALRRLMIATLVVAAALAVAAGVYRTAAVSDRNGADRELADVRAQLDAQHKARDTAAAERAAAISRLARAAVSNRTGRETAVRVAKRSTPARAAAKTVLDSSAAETQLSTVQEQALRAGHFSDYNASRDLYNATYGASNGPYAQQIAALEQLARNLATP